MGAFGIVEIDVLPEQPSKMILVGHDDVAEQDSFHGTDPTFRKAVLPGRSEGRPLRLAAEVSDGLLYSIRED